MFESTPTLLWLRQRRKRKFRWPTLLKHWSLGGFQSIPAGQKITHTCPCAQLCWFNRSVRVLLSNSYLSYDRNARNHLPECLQNTCSITADQESTSIHICEVRKRLNRSENMLHTVSHLSPSNLATHDMRLHLHWCDSLTWSLTVGEALSSHQQLFTTHDDDAQRLGLQDREDIRGTGWRPIVDREDEI